MIDETTKIHFIGIGGYGMSAIAKVLADRGHRVSGSDIKASRNTEALVLSGIEIAIGQGPQNVQGKDLVVISTAISEDNPELFEARRLGLKIAHRAEMLAEILNRGTGIGVAGTHGKTTTTSMISYVLKECGRRPTFIVGGELNDVGSNAESGGDITVAEADESDGSLVCLKPVIGVITNIEADHLDHYATMAQIIDVFRTFCHSIKEKDGLLVACGDDDNALALAEDVGVKHLTYGFGAGNRLRAEPTGDGSYTIIDQADNHRLSLAVPGRHNILNAMAAYAVCRHIGLNGAEICRALAGFSGVKRRFQLKGEKAGITVVDDYAHHPTEVAATLAAAVETAKWKRIVAVFQPHRYSRTEGLAAAFGDAFGDSDLTVITDVYPAGEEPIPGISGRTVIDALLDSEPDKSVFYLPKRADIVSVLPGLLRSGDLLITMGAGDLWMAGEEILEGLNDGPPNGGGAEA